MNCSVASTTMGKRKFINAHQPSVLDAIQEG